MPETPLQDTTMASDMSPRPRILLVSANPMETKVLVDLFRTDFDLVIAKSGAQALDRLHMNGGADLVWLDASTANGDHFELCKEISHNQHTPVFIVADDNDSSDEVRAFECGAVDYIHKPISPGPVKARLLTRIRQARMMSTLP